MSNSYLHQLAASGLDASLSTTPERLHELQNGLILNAGGLTLEAHEHEYISQLDMPLMSYKKRFSESGKVYWHGACWERTLS